MALVKAIKKGFHLKIREVGEVFEEPLTPSGKPMVASWFKPEKGPAPPAAKPQKDGWKAAATQETYPAADSDLI